MSAEHSPEDRPYKGLQPYTLKDRVYFFGREREQEVIESNLGSAVLTVLHGASGVGKSSVLMAGVMPRMCETPGAAVVLFREWQTPQFLAALKCELVRAVEAKVGKLDGADEHMPFADLVRECNRQLEGPVCFIFDQFEEYFQYHPPPQQPGRLDAPGGPEHFDLELARAVNRRDVDAHFLISLREDGLSKLDRLNSRIPNLLGNMLRLEYMDREAAEEAVRGPLAEFNRRAHPPKPVRIEDGLVEELLNQVEAGRVMLDENSGGAAHAASRRLSYRWCSNDCGTRSERPGTGAARSTAYGLRRWTGSAGPGASCARTSTR